MKFLEKNKELFSKYLLIIISNILLFILCDFYLKNFEYASIVLFLLIVIDGLVIYNYKGVKKFNVIYDILTCFIIGLIMLLMERDIFVYSYYIFVLFFANNIVFMLSRKSEKYFIKLLQYFLTLVLTILCMFMNLIVWYILNI